MSSDIVKSSPWVSGTDGGGSGDSPGTYRRTRAEAVAWLDSVVCDADHARILARFEAAFEARGTYRLVFRISSSTADERWIIDEGRVLDAEGDAEPTLGGRFRELDSLLRESANWPEVEAAMREREERFRWILEHSVDALYRGDYRTLQYDYLSPAIERITGFTVEELVEAGQPFLASRIEPSDLPRVMDVIGKLFASGGGRYSVDYRLRHKDGEYRWVSETGTAFTDSQGVPLHGVGAVRDITEQIRQREEREKLEERLRHAQRMESLGTLSGGIAHDFNNVLAAIFGYADWLGRHGEEIEVREEAVDAILTASLRARDLVRQILTFSRHQEPTLVEVRLPMVVGEVARLLRASAPARVEVSWNEQADGTHVRGDPTQLHQLMMNLGVNALQAMPDGGRLEITVSRISADEAANTPVVVGALTNKAYARVSVSDTGSGIPDEVQSRIFEPFFTTKGETQGTGLGLSVVHGIVLGHHGALMLSSDASRGTQFDVYLPLAERPAAEVSPPRVGLVEPRGKRILVVDDEPHLVRLAEHNLRDLGFEPVGIDSAAEVLARLTQTPEEFWAVITDFNMPIMSGLVLARYLSEIAPELPVVIATGDPTQLTPQALESAGIVALLQKPFSLYELQQALELVAAARSAQRDGLSAGAAPSQGEASPGVPATPSNDRKA